jgi:hypothetical protein
MNKWKWIAALLAGVVLGGAVAVLASSSHRAATSDVRAPDSAELEQLRTQAQYVAALHSIASNAPQPQAVQVPAPAPGSDPGQPIHRPTEEERQQETAAAQAAHEARIDQHRAESRDETWASAMENKIDGLLRAHPDAGAGLYASTDCRSQSCVVNFSWPSYGEARADMRAMMARTVPLPCATSLVLPSDDGRSDRVSGSLYLDCTAERQAGVTASR